VDRPERAAIADAEADARSRATAKAANEPAATPADGLARRDQGAAAGRFAAPTETAAGETTVAAVDSRTRALLAIGVRREPDGSFVRLADGAPLALVPAATHALGSPDHPRKVALRAFLIDVEEVSVARWTRFRAAKLASGSAGGHYLCSTAEPATEGHHECAAESDPSLPARAITVWDAACYASWTKSRLPTGGEWEAAARWPDGRRFPWGATFDPARSRTSVAAAAPGPLAVTTNLGASALGIKNLAGNVAEWTLDLGPTGADTAARGGSWTSDDATALDLWRAIPGASVGDLSVVGFRCVVEAPAELGR
jgi:formylglycine-generating enzyme required for sulfatase activity